MFADDMLLRNFASIAIACFDQSLCACVCAASSLKEGTTYVAQSRSKDLCWQIP